MSDQRRPDRRDAPAERGSLSGADATWLHLDQARNPMVVNTVLLFGTRPDWDAVERALYERIVNRFRRFRQRAVEPPLALGVVPPHWEDDARFAIGDHLVHARLPDDTGRASLDRYLGEQACLPLDRDRPLWQAHLIDRPGGGAALLLRTHHALADGMALVLLIEALMDPADGETGTPGARPAPGRGPSIGEVVSSWRDTATLSKLIGRTGALFHRRTRLSGVKTVALSGPVPVEALKAIGRDTGATLNDVVLAAVAGVLRRWPAEALGGRDIVMPVDVRARHATGVEDLGNVFGLVFVRLPADEDEPAARLAAVREQTSAIKGTPEADIVFDSLTVLGRSAPAVARRWVDAFLGEGAAVVTNIRGPARRGSVSGHEVTGMALLVPSTGPIGLGISVLSYAGQAVVSVIADTAVLDRAESVADALHSELARLAAATGTNWGAAPHPAP